MDGQAMMEIQRPRSAWQLVGATVTLYRRFPWLFLALAAVVVIPFDVLSLLEGSQGPLHGPIRVVVGVVLFIAAFCLVLPLISALHVHAVDDVRQGRTPNVRSVGRRGLTTLPVVCVAAGLSWLGIMAGLVVLIVPGVLLFLRWSVVAQAAALGGGKSWRKALERSRSLTSGHYGHIFLVFLLVFVITSVPNLLLSLAFGFRTTVVLFVVRTAIGTATSSFTALAIGLLYFDLGARFELRREQLVPETLTSPSGHVVTPTGHPLDPESYSDEDRPHGWYVDPSAPWNMRYWPGDGTDGYSKRKAKTPKETLAGWHKVNNR